MHHVTSSRSFRLCLRSISNTVQSYNIKTIYPNITILKNVKRVKIVVLRQKKTNSNGIHPKKAIVIRPWRQASGDMPILSCNIQPYIYTHVRKRIKPHTKNIVLKYVKTLDISKYCRIFAAQTNNNNNKNSQL